MLCDGIMENYNKAKRTNADQIALNAVLYSTEFMTLFDRYMFINYISTDTVITPVVVKGSKIKLLTIV